MCCSSRHLCRGIGFQSPSVTIPSISSPSPQMCENAKTSTVLDIIYSGLSPSLRPILQNRIIGHLFGMIIVLTILWLIIIHNNLAVLVVSEARLSVATKRVCATDGACQSLFVSCRSEVCDDGGGCWGWRVFKRLKSFSMLSNNPESSSIGV